MWSITAPNIMAQSISQTVFSMELMPPRVISSSRVALPLLSAKPSKRVCQVPLNRARKTFGTSPASAKMAGRWNISASATAIMAPARIVGMGGNFLFAMTSSASTGSSMMGLMVKFSLMSCSVRARSLPALLASILNPIIVKITSAIRILGMVVHSMCPIWVKRSVPATAGARLVVSDNGDILSPK